MSLANLDLNYQSQRQRGPFGISPTPNAMHKATRHPVIVKTCRSKAVLVGLVCLGLAIAAAIRISLGLPTGLGWVFEPLAALFMVGSALYLFAIAIFRPIVLRMDQDGISGYYAPPLSWNEISKIDTFKEYTDGGPFYTMHVGIKVTHTRALFTGLSRGKYDRALRSYRRNGFHILIPQLILKDMNAAAVASAARSFQIAAERETQIAKPA